MLKLFKYIVEIRLQHGKKIWLNSMRFYKRKKNCHTPAMVA